MKFQTSITELKDGIEIIRGEKLENLVKERSFVATIYLILMGKLPTPQEERMFDAIFATVIDHGPAIASTMCARISTSAKNDIHTSLAAGLLSLGQRHGLALSGAMDFFKKYKDVEDLPALLAELKEKKYRIPGFGHKFFKEKDPRTKFLLEIAKEQGMCGEHCKFAQQVFEELNKISSKPLPLNVDGVIAAILCDMGVSSELGNAFFIIGRVPGIIAHIDEEKRTGPGMRRLTNEDVEFMGDYDF